MSNATPVTEEQLLSLMNLQLKNHPDFIEGMSFDSITSLPNGTYGIRANYNYNGKTTTENYESGSKVYSSVFTEFLA